MSALSQLKLLWSKEEPRAYLIFAAVCMLFAIGLISAVGYQYYQEHGYNREEERVQAFKAACTKSGGFPITLDKYVDGYGDRVCVESLKLIYIPDYP